MRENSKLTLDVLDTIIKIKTETMTVTGKYFGVATAKYLLTSELVISQSINDRLSIGVTSLMREESKNFRLKKYSY